MAPPAPLTSPVAVRQVRQQTFATDQTPIRLLGNRLPGGVFRWLPPLHHNDDDHDGSDWLRRLWDVGSRSLALNSQRCERSNARRIEGLGEYRVGTQHRLEVIGACDDDVFTMIA